MGAGNFNGDGHIAVIGAGSFGSVVAWMLARAGRKVRIWCYQQHEADAINRDHVSVLPVAGLALDGVEALTDAAEVVRDAEAVIMATPSFAVRTAARAMAPALAATAPVLVLSKGIDPTTGEFLYQAVSDEVGEPDRIAVLAGPNHAEELAAGSYAGAVVACKDISIAEYFQGLLSSPVFRLYACDDLIGASVCSAAKNVVAIACGIARGMGHGDNTVSLLMTRGLAEIARLVVACGGSAATCLGLAGVGDLNTTCNSPHSRNGSYGEAFARRGVTVKDYEAERGMVVEGAHALDPLLGLARRHEVELPVAEAVRALLDGSVALADAAPLLMERRLKREWDGSVAFGAAAQG